MTGKRSGSGSGGFSGGGLGGMAYLPEFDASSITQAIHEEVSSGSPAIAIGIGRPDSKEVLYFDPRERRRRCRASIASS